MSDKIFTPRFVVGVDGGGTRCRAVLKDAHDNVLGHGYSGGANPVNGVSRAKKSIHSAIKQAAEQAGLDESDYSQIIVGAGLAGLHLPAMQQLVEAWDHPFAGCFFTSDLEVALEGAFGHEDGGLIILGTGFSAAARVRSSLHFIGGLGFPFNANGSGSWLGLKAVEAALHSADGIGPPTSLAERLLEAQSTVEFAQQLQNVSPHVFARFAPIVGELALGGDEVSLAIIREAVRFLEQVIDRLTTMGAPSVALIGGVSEMLSQWLPLPVLSQLSKARRTPEEGACAFALVQYESFRQKQET